MAKCPTCGRDEERKNCLDCKQYKLLEEFPVQTFNSDGRSCYCQSCEDRHMGKNLREAGAAK